MMTANVSAMPSNAISDDVVLALVRCVRKNVHDIDVVARLEALGRAVEFDQPYIDRYLLALLTAGGQFDEQLLVGLGHWPDRRRTLFDDLYDFGADRLRTNPLLLLFLSLSLTLLLPFLRERAAAEHAGEQDPKAKRNVPTGHQRPYPLNIHFTGRTCDKGEPGASYVAERVCVRLIIRKEVGSVQTRVMTW
jgi:hypothetical protein